MAAQVLKRGQAIVWVPPRSVGERRFASEAVLLAMLPAAVSEQVGGAASAAGHPVTVFGSSSAARFVRVSLDALPALKQVTLVFDARDVNLLRVALPPLSPARAQQALPNLVEDLLLQDAQACAFAIGPRESDTPLRLVAAIDRNWLEFVVGAFERRGIRVQAAWPAQLALPLGAGQLALACLHDGLALRMQQHEGIGWSAGGDDEARVEAIACALDAAGADSPESAIPDVRRRVAVFVEDGSWQAPVLKAAARADVEVDLRALAFPVAAPVDLLSARSGSAARRWLADVDWRAWRVPAAAAAACVVVALLGLNLHWALLSQESDRLRASIEQRYRDAFPGTQVVVDPMLQMQRQVSSLRARAGQAGPDDFVPLLARFSQALGGQAIDALASVEFREGRLRVRFQPGFFEGRSARDGLARTGQQFGLSVRFDADREPTAAVSLLR
ncbi:MAG: type II secretion system protein GspL [Burkholderiaceae bacterium]|nr:type II secretion system protein GspL [Burkholderiaceae bacterium]